MSAKTLCFCGLFIVSLLSCTKETASGNEKFEGKYNGIFHDVASCFGCVPFRDTMFSGSFEVTYNGDDSIKILRSHDQNIWKFPLSSDSVFTMSSGTTWGISFTFNSGNKLKYFESRSGSGGYFRTTFDGIK